MKKSILLLILSFLSSSALCQVSIGIRDTQYAQLGYRFNNTCSIGIEHSLYSDHIDYQKIRLLFGYSFSKDYFKVRVSPYVSTLWGGEYHDYGCYVINELWLLELLGLDFTVNTHYDSQLGFMFCTYAGFAWQICKDFSLLLHYSSIPEFRMKEYRLRAGIKLAMGELWVKPEISLPLTGQIKSCRVLCSFGYCF